MLVDGERCATVAAVNVEDVIVFGAGDKIGLKMALVRFFFCKQLFCGGVFGFGL